MTNLTVQLMDNDFKRLIKTAKQRGKSVQALIYDWISQLPEVEESYDVTDDPIFTIDGFESDAPKNLSIDLDKFIYGDN
ncbi:hypothetical protein H8E88_08875 [candidate division KSB1 bacterium]|nr:hypothetical protein [candidate division KSB1 bacterium]MBL7092526.1 hypothetical protein [candidate division KSB1 bacterium]